MNEDATNTATRPDDKMDEIEEMFTPAQPTAEQLAWLRDRVEGQDVLLASQLRRFRQQEGWTHEQLAGHLGLTTEGLDRLGLAGRPRGDRFAADVRAIAAANGVPDLQLMQLLRNVESRAAFVGSAAARRIVAAARDHDDPTPVTESPRPRGTEEPDQPEDHRR